VSHPVGYLDDLPVVGLVVLILSWPGVCCSLLAAAIRRALTPQRSFSSQWQVRAYCRKTKGNGWQLLCNTIASSS
jgi:hypothetical protein